MRSDSCARSSAALDVRNACPRMSIDVSSRNGGRRTPPLRRVNAPDAHESRMTTRRSADARCTRERSSSYDRRSLPIISPSSSEWPE